MKKIIAVIMTIIMSAGIALAAGGKNQGTTGNGTTSTGGDAKGQASQDRTGR